ncbi:DUF3618 domain-containing protein [Dermabacteraceae bacterium P13115]
MAKKKQPSLDEMEQEALRRQDNLASDIDELLDRVNPKNVAQRVTKEAKDKIAGFFVADDGNPRTENISVLAGAVVGITALAVGAILLKRRK